jgi:hypothetical protein
MQTPTARMPTRQYHALRKQIAERAALARLNEFRAQGRSVEFQQAAREFLQQFPGSSVVEKVRENIQVDQPTSSGALQSAAGPGH